MRADAQRNYDRIVEVASELFAERGTDASLNEIAKRAGVGPGTLYRHFPTRETLIDVAMKRWVDRIHTAADMAVASAQPPRAALLWWFEAVVAHISQYRGGPSRLAAAMGHPDSPLYDRYLVVAKANAMVLDQLAAEGALRQGIDTLQVCRLVGGVAIVADQGELDATAVRPLLEIVADGLLR